MVALTDGQKFAQEIFTPIIELKESDIDAGGLATKLVLTDAKDSLKALATGEEVEFTIVNPDGEKAVGRLKR